MEKLFGQDAFNWAKEHKTVIYTDWTYGEDDEAVVTGFTLDNEEIQEYIAENDIDFFWVIPDENILIEEEKIVFDLLVKATLENDDDDYEYGHAPLIWDTSINTGYCNVDYDATLMALERLKDKGYCFIHSQDYSGEKLYEINLEHFPLTEKQKTALALVESESVKLKEIASNISRAKESIKELPDFLDPLKLLISASRELTETIDSLDEEPALTPPQVQASAQPDHHPTE